MRIFLICAVACALAAAQDSRYAPQGGQIPGPAKSSDFAEWLADIKQWRAERITRIGYHGSEYDRATLICHGPDWPFVERVPREINSGLRRRLTPQN